MGRRRIRPQPEMGGPFRRLLADPGMESRLAVIEGCRRIGGFVLARIPMPRALFRLWALFRRFLDGWCQGGMMSGPGDLSCCWWMVMARVMAPGEEAGMATSPGLRNAPRGCSPAPAGGTTPHALRIAGIAWRAIS